MTRAPAGGSACSAARAASSPATTIWPPPLKLAGCEPEVVELGEQLGLVAAEHGAHAGRRPAAAASAIARAALRRRASSRRPRSGCRRRPPRRSRRPSGRRSPASLLAAAAVEHGGERAGSRRRRSAAARPRCRGWCRRPTPCRACAGRCPRPRARASRCSANRGSASQGSRNPGVCEPCPGATMTTVTRPACQLSGHRQLSHRIGETLFDRTTASADDVDSQDPAAAPQRRS